MQPVSGIHLPKKVITLQLIQFRINCKLFQSAQTTRTPISECANESHTHFKVRKRVATPFQSAQTSHTLISECANELHAHFRVRKRVAHPFQSVQTSCTPISECTNELHTHFRVRKRVAHPFQSVQTSCTSISECANELHALNFRALLYLRPLPGFGRAPPTSKTRKKYFRVRKRVARPFQSAQTSRAPISECANESHTNFRVRERVAHPFQSARTTRAPISECANELHAL